MAFWGVVLVGPSMHYWYSGLDRIVRAPGLRGTLTKLAVDQTVFAPSIIAAFFTYTSLSEGRGIEGVKERLSQVYLPSLKANYMLWPAANFVNFYVRGRNVRRETARTQPLTRMPCASTVRAIAVSSAVRQHGGSRVECVHLLGQRPSECRQAARLGCLGLGLGLEHRAAVTSHVVTAPALLSHTHTLRSLAREVPPRATLQHPEALPPHTFVFIRFVQCMYVCIQRAKQDRRRRLHTNTPAVTHTTIIHIVQSIK